MLYYVKLVEISFLYIKRIEVIIYHLWLGGVKVVHPNDNVLSISYYFNYDHKNLALKHSMGMVTKREKSVNVVNVTIICILLF